MRIGGTPLKTLDFDIENMPVTYYAPDYPTALITAIGWAFTDDPDNIEVRVLRDPSSDEEYMGMLYDFRQAFVEADLVVGHYILKHDLPIVNGALVEMGLPILPEKLVQDTKQDLVSFSAIPKNQEFLEAIMHTEQQKVQMTQADWRESNRFFQTGIDKTIDRVTSDVRGNMQMRDELIERGLLKPPRLWTP